MTFLASRPRRLLLAALLVSGMTNAALAENPAPPPGDDGKVTDFTLGNGMEVVVIPDHRAPIVTHMVWYKVGSADEPPGKSGIAHFFEHLMFKATSNHPAGEFDAAISAIGGNDNAFTSRDVTAYFQHVEASRLDLVAMMESDRFASARLAFDFSFPGLARRG